MKYTLTLATLMFISLGMNTAQTASEALRYSTFNVLGTARSVSTAGAMSPLGGDFSVLNLNPAGVATYRGSEFTITPAFFSNNTDARLQASDATTFSESSNDLLLANVGVVIASKPRDTKWKTSNFAIGISKVADYHQRFQYAGSTPGSVTDRYRELAYNKVPDDLEGEAVLAYNSGAIYDFDGDLTYESDYLQAEPDAPLFKRQTFESNGYNSELTFTYGANYDEKVQFGFGIGVPILSYEERKVYREDDTENTIPYFNALRYEEFLSTSGSGFNVKAGVIFKPVEAVNIGLAYHSRTRYSLSDNYYSSLEYDYTDQTNDGPQTSDSPDGSFRYNLRTPSSLEGGIGVVIARSGFLTAGFTYNDFGNARFKYTGRGNGLAFSDEEKKVNLTIQDQLSDAVTFRTGAELAIKKFRLRAGLELDQSPYLNDDSFDPTYNAGIGYRGDEFFIDLAYQHFTLQEGYLPYAVENAYQPFVTEDIVNHRIFLTLAYRWH